MNIKNTRRWTIIFSALSNINRLKIVDMLIDGRKINVGGISERLNISIKATSNHLARLRNLNILDAEGKDGQVFYSISYRLPKDAEKAIKLMLE